MNDGPKRRFHVACKNLRRLRLAKSLVANTIKDNDLADTDLRFVADKLDSAIEKVTAQRQRLYAAIDSTEWRGEL